MARKTKIYIDLIPATKQRKSGVGFSLEQAVKAINKSTIVDNYTVVGFTTIDNKKRAIQLGLNKFKLIAIPLPEKIFNGLFKFNLLPAIDRFLGRGLYIFYNFRTLPLTNRSKAITCVHDLTYLKYPEFCEPKNLVFLSKFVPITMREATTILAVSESVSQDLKVNYPASAEKVITLYNTIGDEFAPQPKERVRATQLNYGIGIDPYLLFVGNQEPRKNIISVLRALEKFSPKDAPAFLMIGGERWGEDVVGQKVEELISAGYRILRPVKYVTDEDLPSLISGALCMVTPSVYEGFSYPPLQAILCGVPAVVSDNLPILEIVNNFSKIKYNDSNALYEAIQGIIKSTDSSPGIDRTDIMAKVGYKAFSAQLETIIQGAIDI